MISLAIYKAPLKAYHLEHASADELSAFTFVAMNLELCCAIVSRHRLVSTHQTEDVVSKRQTSLQAVIQMSIFACHAPFEDHDSLLGVLLHAGLMYIAI
jgi:hypothetical protein